MRDLGVGNDLGIELVGQRRRLLNYLKKQDIERYRSLIAELGIRK